MLPYKVTEGRSDLFTDECFQKNAQEQKVAKLMIFDKLKLILGSGVAASMLHKCR